MFFCSSYCLYLFCVHPLLFWLASRPSVAHPQFNGSLKFSLLDPGTKLWSDFLYFSFLVAENPKRMGGSHIRFRLMTVSPAKLSCNWILLFLLFLFHTNTHTHSHTQIIRHRFDYCLLLPQISIKYLCLFGCILSYFWLTSKMICLFLLRFSQIHIVINRLMTTSFSVFQTWFN